MYAVVRIGGKQYQVEEGQAIVTEKLPFEVGESIKFDDVLLIADGADTLIGTPILEGASVTAEVVEQFRGKKVIVYKYKPKQRYRRKKGHRQRYTRLMINSIAAGS